MTTEQDSNAQQINTSTRPGSYDRFAQRAHIIDIDKQTAALLPQAERFLDIATGTGAMIEQLRDQKKILEGGMVVGVDIDPHSLAEAEKKFAYHPEVTFRQGTAEQLPFEDESFDAGVLANFIHLAEPKLVFPEVYRVLRPGGIMVVNSAYTADAGIPDRNAQIQWGRLVVGAKRALEAEGILVGDPLNLTKYSVDQYAAMAQEARFSRIQTQVVMVPMDRGDVLAICDFDGFANGALPRVPVHRARQALTDSANKLFDLGESKMQDKGEFTILRGWMLMRAQKSGYSTTYISG